MSASLPSFWNLLSSSGLLVPAVANGLIAEAQAEKNVQSVQDVVRWLVDKNVLTQYQADVLANGQATDFLFGNYRLTDPLLDDDSVVAYRAVHRSGFPVRLQFVPGRHRQDLNRWLRVQQRADQLSACEHSSLATCYQTVKLPEYRMVVSELPTGKPLAELLPAKARLPWQQASKFGLQLAQAVAELHRNGLAHGAIGPTAINLLAANTLRLDVDPLATEGSQWTHLSQRRREEIAVYCGFEGGTDADVNTTGQPGDVHAIGALVFLMVGGRQIKGLTSDRRTELLVRREVPSWLAEIIRSATDSDLIQRTSITELVDRFRENGVEDVEYAGAKRRDEFRQAITSAMPGQIVGNQEPDEVWVVPQIEGVGTIDGPSEIQIEVDAEPGDQADTQQRIAEARASIGRREKLRWFQPLLLFASCLLVGSAFAGMYHFGRSTSGGNGEAKVVTAAVDSKKPVVVARSDEASSNAPAIVDHNFPTIQQQLIDDDGTTLWQAPTEGQRLDFEYLPPAPKLILHLRPQSLLQHDEGQRLVPAMGPGFQRVTDYFSRSVGLPLPQIDEALVSFHQNDNEQYQWFAVITCSGINSVDWLQSLGELSTQRSIDDDLIYSRDGVGYFLLSQTSGAGQTVGNGSNDQQPAGDADVESESSGTGPDPIASRSQPVSQGQQVAPFRFLVGPVDLLKSVVDVGRGFPVFGSLQKLQLFSDRDRHASFFYLRPSLFNGRGRSWMGPNLVDFNRQLSELIPDEVQGGLLSLHVADGNYVELVFDRSVDIKTAALQTRIQQGIDRRLQGLFELNQRIPADDYWRSVQDRYQQMVQASLQEVRWGVEGEQLIGNAWLPPMAVHNVIAASELVAAFRLSATQARGDQRETPQDLAQLLEQPRDLDVANPPDLNVLMAELESEINSDYGQLPFQWRIVLQGAELEKDGITKNQRPGPLKLTQATLAEILTSIVVSANPDQGISGPSDDGCKLIWVLAEDPEFPQRQAILITTRQAAAQKDYSLPAAFKKPTTE